MFYILGHIKQDWFCSLSCIESLLSFVKQTVLPTMKCAKLKCDNAGINCATFCIYDSGHPYAGNYHNNDFVQGLVSVSQQTGVKITNLDTSEPGCGKVIAIILWIL